MNKILLNFIIVCFLTGNVCLIVEAQNQSSISGMVYDATSRKPVSDLYVELMNELYITLKRVKKESSGRYFFDRLSKGVYKIKVIALGTNYESQTQEVQLITFTRTNTNETPDNVYLDFYLKLDPRKIDTSGGINQVVFAQEVPDKAKILYKKGIEQLASKNEIGFATIEEAIDIFPNYYEALNLLGTELVQKQKYQEAFPFLIKAIDVNQRSFTSFYALGYACYKLGKITESIEAFRATTILSPQSINAHLFYGVVLRQDGQYTKAETELKQAKSLSKNTPFAEIHWQLGLLYNKIGRNIEAADELELFLKIQPKTPDADKIRELIAKLRKTK